MSDAIKWPDGRAFAFTAFDDADLDVLRNTRPVYEFLAELGMRTTKSVWPLDGRSVADTGEVVAHDHPFYLEGLSCENPEYLRWAADLQRQGFELGWHNARCYSSTRDITEQALNRFKEHFGHWPGSMSNHFSNREAIYWGDARLSGVYKWIYALSNLHRRNQLRYYGHAEQSEFFWGDLCRERIGYVRNFVFRDINTLKACPEMPYHDPRLPYVNAWFSSSEGGEVESFNVTLDEAAQDRLAEEGGACIMYTHFAKRFFADGKLNPRFKQLMHRLASMNGWFVPVSELLDYLKTSRGGIHTLTDAERNRLQRRWLMSKLFHGSS